MNTTYDSTADTIAHITRVQQLLEDAIQNLKTRQQTHDLSKLKDPEKTVFDEMTPKLKHSTYGSDEYRSFLDQMKPALDHHYAHNPHHPEHYPDGISGMSLLDLIEMLCDWKAAGERHANGSITNSLNINQTRFKIEHQLQSVLTNTAKEFNWITP
jgi:predicted alpha/beta superfamily hydrolase